jgi:hypothetical protein
MPSQIDPTLFRDGVPVQKEDLRQTLATVRGELDHGGYFTAAADDVISRRVAERLSDTINVKDFGARGDGITDDTEAIERAWNTARQITDQPSGHSTFTTAVRGALVLPPGNYVYNGPGLDIDQNFQSINSIALYPKSVRILLGPDSYFISTNENNLFGGLFLFGISFDGGKGAIRLGRTAPNTPAALKRVEACEFVNYTEAAIAALTADSGMWAILFNQFLAAPGADRSIGLAIAGYNDNSVVAHNFFKASRYHLRLGIGGNRILIENNGFFSLGDWTPNTCSIHLVPRPNHPANAGTGVRIWANKFGVEGIKAGDHRVLIADLDDDEPGNFSRAQHTTNESVGFARGLWLLGNDHGMNAALAPEIAAITSYTKFAQDIRFDDLLAVEQGPIWSFPHGRPENSEGQSQITFVQKSNASKQLLAAGEQPGVVLDPLAVFPTHRSHAFWGGDSLTIREVALGPVDQWAGTDALVEKIVDPGAEVPLAYRIEFQGVNARVSQPDNSFSLAAIGIEDGDPLWVELPVCGDETNPALRAAIVLEGVNPRRVIWRREISVPPSRSGWLIFRAPMVACAQSAGLAMRIEAAGYTADQKFIQIGQPRLYAARSPVAAPRALRIANGYLWLDSAGRLRVSTAMPGNYETEGRVVG